MPEIDFEASYKLEGSAFDSRTVGLVLDEGDAIYVNDSFMEPQELLDWVSKLLAEQGYVRLAVIPRDIEELGASPRVNVFKSQLIAVRSLNPAETELVS